MKQNEFLSLRVINVLNDKDLRTIIRKYLTNIPISSKLGILRLGKKKVKPIRVKILLDYPLTTKNSKIVTISNIGDIYCEVADFYGDLYKANSILDNDRKFIWGHTIDDLGFNAMYCRRANHKDYSAIITFAMGS